MECGENIYIRLEEHTFTDIAMITEGKQCRGIVLRGYFVCTFSDLEKRPLSNHCFDFLFIARRYVSYYLKLVSNKVN